LFAPEIGLLAFARAHPSSLATRKQHFNNRCPPHRQPYDGELDNIEPGYSLIFMASATETRRTSRSNKKQTPKGRSQSPSKGGRSSKPASTGRKTSTSGRSAAGRSKTGKTRKTARRTVRSAATAKAPTTKRRQVREDESRSTPRKSRGAPESGYESTDVAGRSEEDQPGNVAKQGSEGRSSRTEGDDLAEPAQRSRISRRIRQDSNVRAHQGDEPAPDFAARESAGPDRSVRSKSLGPKPRNTQAMGWGKDVALEDFETDLLPGVEKTSGYKGAKAGRLARPRMAEGRRRRQRTG
jgi:hypothetical protein